MGEIENYMVWIWLGIFVLSIGIEATTQDYVSIWFGAGALVSLILAIIPGIPWWVELIVFACISALALICTRPLVKKIVGRGAEAATNIDSRIGKRVKCEKAISKFDAGQIKINGIEYTAILMEEVNDTIEEGTIVEIVAFKGNKVVVRKIVEEEKEGENIICF